MSIYNSSPIILAGYLYTEINNSTLPQSYPGDKQRVSFSKKLSDKIVGMLLTSDIYALLGSYKDTNREMVRLIKGSYNSSTNSITLIRGISKFATNEYADNCVLFSRPSQLFLDFGVINPFVLQSLNNPNSTQAVSPSNILEPGIIKTAYRPEYLKQIDSQAAITSDNPAYRNLCKALFGLNTGAAETGFVSEFDNLRVNVISQLVDYLVQDTSRLDKFKKLIDAVK
jgi:hypothetical protein